MNSPTRGVRTGRKRKHVRPRCPVCALHSELCACAELRPVELTTRLLVIQHARERRKPTNTVRFLMHMVAGTQLVHYGVRGEPGDIAGLLASVEGPLVLYPRESARVLEPATPHGPQPPTPRTLILLDGTWRQARRLAGRVPGLGALPFVTLPAGASSSWPVRHAPDPRHLCTFEAALRALAILDGEEAVRPLDLAFQNVMRNLHDMKRGAVGPPPVAPSEVGGALAMRAQVADVDERDGADHE